VRQTYAVVRLGDFKANLHAVRFRIGDARLMAIVKADAYGHGLVPVARAAEEAGADWLGVALAEEGAQLRAAGIRLPILILAGSNAGETSLAVENGLTLTIFTPGHLTIAQEAAKRAGRLADAHLKLDTGMNRIGVKDEAALLEMLRLIQGCPDIRLSGGFTHFASADSPDPTQTDRQLARFNRLITLLPPGLLLHTSGTSALLSRPDARFGMVRAGLALYGYAGVDSPVPLVPVLSWMAEITHVKTVAPGETVSYGAIFTATRPTRLATIAAGYGDGLNRLRSNRGTVLIGGRRCPIVGRVCMDQTMADVTDAGPVSPGDPAVLIGRQGGEAITADEIARELGTIPYEVLLQITARVPRDYR